MVLVLAVAQMAAGCSPGLDEEALFTAFEEAASHQDGQLELPGSLEGVGEWDEMIPVCPYAPTESLPPEYRAQARSYRLEYNETKQYLFVKMSDGQIHVASADKRGVEWCHVGSPVARIAPNEPVDYVRRDGLLHLGKQVE